MNHTMQEYMPCLVPEIKEGGEHATNDYFFTLSFIAKGSVKTLWTKVNSNSYMPIMCFLLH